MQDVRGIPANEVPAIWPRVRPIIKRALEHSPDYSLRDVKGSLCAEHRQLFVTWPEVDTICITGIEDRPKRRVLVIWWKAGKLHDDWRQMLTATENWGRSLDCRRVEFRGRKGWERLLSDYKTETLYSKDL